ncbi:unnamed protein product [Lactuca saligna]|uniref:GRF-type domain-containing protein n=1 Tax=Lactuca saligna TaxID=75948 RepID=A0AA35V3N7_LACSI|nr:unnamed protein product [Lactuca saligna]CAI9302983.1 unnamed protein product [Lactuca saligna]
MSSSSSIGSKVMRRFNPPQRTHCDCGDLVGRWTSWKTRNPGRRFIGCPNYRDSSKDCKFFDWVDPPLPNQWYKDLLLQLHNGWNGDVVEQMEEAVVEVVPAQVQGAGGVVPRWSMFWFILGLCFGLYFKIMYWDM